MTEYWYLNWARQFARIEALRRAMEPRPAPSTPPAQRPAPEEKP